MTGYKIWLNPETKRYEVDDEATVVDYDFEEENANIKKYYQPTHTIKVGAEFVFNPIAIRLGYAYMSNPYRDLDKDGSCHTFACGMGFKGKIFFADFAYLYKMYNDKDIFYNADNLKTYSLKKHSQNFVLTIGWKLGKI